MSSFWAFSSHDQTVNPYSLRLRVKSITLGSRLLSL
jgi:hypothetical protein